MPHPRFLSFFCVLFLSIIVSVAGASPPAPEVGDTYKITLIRETSHKSALSSGGSQNRTTIIERVIGLRADGLELEYDLPETTTDKERARHWQFPTQVFKPLNGPPQLLNSAELEERVDSWLKTFGVPRAACGRTIFTWNAFRIECDPQSVIKIIESYDLGAANLQDGAPYYDAAARGVGKLAKKVVEPDDVSFTAEVPVDPDVVRRTRAEADVTIGELTNKPVTLEDALRQREKQIISGTISVVFKADPAGNAHRRTKVTTIDIKGSDSESETSTTTETLERQLISAR